MENDCNLLTMEKWEREFLSQIAHEAGKDLNESTINALYCGGRSIFERFSGWACGVAWASDNLFNFSTEAILDAWSTQKKSLMSVVYTERERIHTLLHLFTSHKTRHEHWSSILCYNHEKRSIFPHNGPERGRPVFYHIYLNKSRLMYFSMSTALFVSIEHDGLLMILKEKQIMRL